MRQPSRTLAALGTIVTGVGVGVFALVPAARADTTTVTYFYSGAEQTFAIPPNVTHLHVDAVGGSGGSSLAFSSTGTEAGGTGATISADVPVTPSTTLYIEVGGNGQNGAATTDGSGGWNGGGAGKADNGAGGGGASDVRTVPSGAAGSLGSRLLVAGGGGGAAFGAPGGAAGSDAGSADAICVAPGGPGGGGSASSGGSGGSGGEGILADGAPGVAGAGGTGGDGTTARNPGGGGGGGGYYGGGGGGEGSDCGGGGGGGSTYATPGSTFSTPVADFGNRTWITISYVVPMTPLVTTTPASDIGQTSATLNGVLTPETLTPPDAGALCYFEYGTDTNYGTHSLGGGCGTGMGQVYDWETVTNLLPGTRYHYRLVASNRYGFSYGDDMQFTTLSPPPPAPSSTTSPATNVGQHQATLHGVVNPQGYATTYHFQYGKTASYGKSTANRSAGNGNSNVNVQATLTGLLRHTTYHFRVVAVSVNGTTMGADQTFHTG